MKLMKELLVEDVALTPDIQKKATRIFNAAKKEMARYGKSKAELKPVKDNMVELIFEMQRFMHPEDIKAAYEDVTDAIKRADTEGHIFKLEETGSGEHFVDAMLGGLRPGMKPIMVEAFFPTFMWDITWKNIVSKGNKR
jgi:hypothetical protein